MILLTFFLLVLPLALAYPQTGTPVINPRATSVNIETGFTGFAGCSDTQDTILKKNINDAVRLADAGLDEIHNELSPDTYPQRNHQQVDFSKQAAIDFFGPESKNAPEQPRIFDATFNAARAYPGWGFSDWWKNRYVFLSCIDELQSKPCGLGPVNAYYTPDKRYGYPLVVFCPRFFSELPSLDDAIKKVDNNPDLKQNSMNTQSQATTFMHELLHIDWGTAKECRGLTDDVACKDQWQIMGGRLAQSYRPGAAKLLAKRNITLASTNNDNYAYYAAAKFMQKRWKQYPKYPSAWDPKKTFAENYRAQMNEPGFPPDLKNAVVPDDYDGNEVKESEPANVPDDPVYPAEAYPEWYQPIVKAASGDPVPDVTEPSGQLTYNGPTNDGIVCETSDGSPEINDCYYAFGALKLSGTLEALHGKKGGTWWAGYVKSCALAIYYTDDWGDGCAMSLKDVDDYSTAILEKCATGDKNGIGGHAQVTLPNCPGYVQIIHTGGQPPRGNPP